MTQLDLESWSYRSQPPSVAGSDTSVAAAESMAKRAGFLRTKVLRLVGSHPNGVTCDEVEALLGLRHQTASARVRELVLSGHLVDSGARRKTRSGRSAAVWVSVPVLGAT